MLTRGPSIRIQIARLVTVLFVGLAPGTAETFDRGRASLRREIGRLAKSLRCRNYITKGGMFPLGSSTGSRSALQLRSGGERSPFWCRSCRRQTDHAGRGACEGGVSRRPLGAFALALVIFLLPASAQSPPRVSLDRQLLQSDSEIGNPDYLRARTAMEKILDLQSRDGLQGPGKFWEFYVQNSDVLPQLGSPELALEDILRYLRLDGREGQGYMAAVKLRNSLAWDILAFQEESGERAAREATAEQWARWAAVMAVRRRAAREMPEEIKAMEFVRIPTGEFRMLPIGRIPSDDESPVKEIRIIEAFELGKYEVTQSEWVAVMGENPSRIACGRCPVTGASWDNVQRFVGLLNLAVAEESPYRLPSKAEWEYAARAGTAGNRNEAYLDAIPRLTEESGGPFTAGQKPVNAFGLHDMRGSVWEWVRGRYQDLRRRSMTDRFEGIGAVVGRPPAASCALCWVEYRSSSLHSYRSDHLGFRVARTLQ